MTSYRCWWLILSLRLLRNDGREVCTLLYPPIPRFSRVNCWLLYNIMQWQFSLSIRTNNNYKTAITISQFTKMSSLWYNDYFKIRQIQYHTSLWNTKCRISEYCYFLTQVMWPIATIIIEVCWTSWFALKTVLSWRPASWICHQLALPFLLPLHVVNVFDTAAAFPLRCDEGLSCYDENSSAAWDSCFCLTPGSLTLLQTQTALSPHGGVLMSANRTSISSYMSPSNRLGDGKGLVGPCFCMRVCEWDREVKQGQPG